MILDDIFTEISQPDHRLCHGVIVVVQGVIDVFLLKELPKLLYASLVVLEVSKDIFIL